MDDEKKSDSLEIKLESKEEIDILELMQAAIRKMHEKEIAEKKAKENVEKKTKIKKKDDISIVIDDETKADDDWDKVLQITVDMDGFDKFHIDQYTKQIEQYKRFLAEYLQEGSYKATYMYNPEDEEAEINQDEMIAFDELWDTLEWIKWNQAAGQNNNYIDPDLQETLGLWSLFSYNRLKMQLWGISGDGSPQFCGLNMY